MADIVQCRDRWNRLIVLPEATWYGKILLDHPELEGNESRVRRVVVDPDLVTFDRDSAEREVFYRWAALPSPDEQAFLKVCVSFAMDDDGEIIGRVVTAYAVDRIKPGERAKWQKQV